MLFFAGESKRIAFRIRGDFHRVYVFSHSCSCQFASLLLLALSTSGWKSTLWILEGERGRPKYLKGKLERVAGKSARTVLRSIPWHGMGVYIAMYLCLRTVGFSSDELKFACARGLKHSIIFSVVSVVLCVCVCDTRLFAAHKATKCPRCHLHSCDLHLIHMASLSYILLAFLPQRGIDSSSSLLNLTLYTYG